MIEDVVRLAIVLAFAILAGWTDITRRHIANRLVVVCLAAGLCFAIWSGGLSALGWHAVHAVVALLVGMVLFAIRAVGGGDGKFYAAVAAFFPLQQGLSLGIAIALAGGFLLAVWLVWRLATRARRKSHAVDGEDLFARLPYGVAIGAGATALAAMPLLY